ncbi:hypothetical protein JCM17724A_04210 [Prevotella fusca JCM 17724]
MKNFDESTHQDGHEPDPNDDESESGMSCCAQVLKAYTQSQYQVHDTVRPLVYKPYIAQRTLWDIHETQHPNANDNDTAEWISG